MIAGSKEWLEAFASGLTTKAPSATAQSQADLEVLRKDLDEAAAIIFALSKELDARISIMSGLENKLAGLRAEVDRLRQLSLPLYR